jgi:hypothetical protein
VIGGAGTRYAPPPAVDAAAAAQALIEQARQRQRRRRRRRLLLAVALLLLAAALVDVVKGLPGRTTAGQPPSAPSPPLPVMTMPSRIVVWTSDFRIEVISSRTGQVIRTIAADVAEIRGLPSLAVSPAGMVYFDTARGIQEWVLRVPMAGGRPAAVAEGCKPALSPDGRLLAFVINCDGATHSPEAIAVKNLASGAERTWAPRSYGMDISGLWWSPDDRWLSFTDDGTPSLTTQVLQIRSSGTFRQARRIPLGPGVQWAGYLTPRTGLAIIARPWPSPGVLAEVEVSSGRILRRLTTLPPPGLATANSNDGTEGTVIADPAGPFVLIAGAGTGTGEIFRWAFGMVRPVKVISGSSRATWG